MAVNPEDFANGDGSTTLFPFTFEYLEESDVKVSVDGSVKTQTTDYTFANATTISFNTAPPSGTDNVRIYRDTDVGTLKSTFFPGSAIRADDLNDNLNQNNYAVQEIKAYTWDNETETIHSNETWVSSDTQIATTQAMDGRFWDQDGDTIDSTETWQDSDSYIATAGAVDSAIDEAITNDIGTDGTGITVTDDGDGTITLGLAQNTIDFDRLKNSDIINQAEQDADSVNPADTNVFTALAAARRFDTLVQTGTPTGSTWETGKTWYQNDEDKTVYVWDGDSWEAITSGGAFTRLNQVIYVDSINGDDNNNGHRISTPKKTIKAALSDINSDSTYGDGSTILVSPGVYQEAAPLDIQKKDVSIIGASIRNVIVHPTAATETNSLFRVNSGSYLQNMTFTGVKASGTRGAAVANDSDPDNVDGAAYGDTPTSNQTTYGLPPVQGWNVSFYPDAKIYKSPYIQNCTNFSDSEIDNDNLNFYAGTEDKGRAGDLDSAPTGGGLLIDGNTVHDDSPLRSIVADSYTHVGLDGPGILVTNNGYVQVTSSYAFFNHYHIKCKNGGQANLAASTTDFGRYSLIAEGRSTSPIFTATTSAEATSGSETFTIGAPSAGSNWHGSATRPQDNMLVDIGGNTYPVLSAVANGSGWDVTISRPNTADRTENLGLNGTVASGSTASFYLRSMIASSGHTMEYVGSGTDYSALPENGGVPNDNNQVVELDNGKVWSAITDHNGTFKVGETFEVNQQTGFVNIPAGALSVSKLLANLDVNGKEIVTDSGNENIVINPHGTGAVNVSSSRIINVTDPTSAQDAATKAYVDSLESDLEGGQLDNLYFRQDTGETIESGDTWSSSDSSIATTAAIDARVIDLVDDVGGFVPIANETSFPTSNPDVNDGAGTLISIKEIGTSRTPSSGTVTIANGSGSNTVTINGCGTTVLASGFGCIVETTSTLHTYNFHRLTPKATEVTTVAGSISNINTVAGDIANVNTAAGSIANINTVANDLNEATSEIDTVATNITNVNNVGNKISEVETVADDISNVNTVAGSISNVNTTAGSISNVNTVASNIASVNGFANKYRIGSTDPTTDNDDGDLFYNTTSDVLKIWDGSAWQTGVTDTAGFVTTSGATMTGQLNTITPTSGSNATNKTYVDDTIDSKIDTALTGDVVGGTGITVSDNTPNSGQITIDVTAGSIGATQLAATTVSAGTYGESQGGVPSFTVDADGRLTAASTDTSPNINGTLTTNRLVVDDDGSANPTAVFKADDHGPWAVCIKNDTYSTDENIGLKFYQENGGAWNILANGDDEYRTLRIRQSNDLSADRDGIVFGDDGSVQLYYQGGTSKLNTTSTGINVTGTVTSTGLYTDGTATITGNTTIGSSTDTSVYNRIDFEDSGGIGFFNLNAHGTADFKFLHNRTGSTNTGIPNSSGGIATAYGVPIYFANNNTARAYFDTNGHFRPAGDSTYNLGASSERWANVYADNLYGDGSNLTGIAAGATGGGSDEIFWENGQTVTSNYTITNNKNAMSAGPITINSGVTVTVGAGENWVIV